MLSAQELPRADTVTLIDELLAEQRSLTAVERFSRQHELHAAPAQARYYRDLIPLTRPQPGEQYAFEVDLDQCTGCKGCVTACHALNGLDDDESWRNVGLLVGGINGHAMQQTVTTACHHCVDPGCLNGCPVLAYEKDPGTGIVRHLDDQCIGCQYCVMKCPYDVPKYSERLGIVRKCDLCHQRLAIGEAPACVQACPNEAIKITLVEHRAIRDTYRTPAPLENNFLAASPAPNYTLPATRYKTNRPVVTMLKASDESALRLQPAHWPLVFLLVFSQASVGLALAAWIVISSPKASLIEPFPLTPALSLGEREADRPRVAEAPTAESRMTAGTPFASSAASGRDFGSSMMEKSSGTSSPMDGPAGAPRTLPPPHEPGHLLSPSLSSIPNGGEGGRRPGEEALRGSAVQSVKAPSGNSLPKGEGRGEGEGSDVGPRGFHRRSSALVDPALILLGGAAVFMASALGIGGLHLGRPVKAWRVFLGWRRSWFSREAIAFGAYIGAIAAAAFVAAAGFGSDRLHVSVATVAVLLGLFSVFCSLMLYVDTRREFWSATHAGLRFLGTTALLGFAGWVVVASLTNGASIFVLGFLPALSLLKVAGELLVFRHHNAEGWTPLKRSARLLTGPLHRVFSLRLALLVAGGVALPGLVLAGLSPLAPMTAMVAFTLLLAGELAERYLFFKAVSPTQMPGGVPA